MRFLFLTSHYYPVIFGAELFAQKIAENLVSQGHQVDLLTGEWDDNWKLDETVNGVHIHRIKTPKIRYLQTILYTMPLKLAAEKLIAKKKYDVVHAHIYPALLVGHQFHQIPHRVVTIQGGDLADYPEIYGAAAPLIRPLIAHALTQYDLVHTTSTDLANQVKALSRKLSVIIPNGVEVDNLKKDHPEFDLPNTAYIACSPSRLTEKNNLAATIEAIHLVRRKNIDIGLVIAGSGHLDATLKDLVVKYKLEKYVKFLGAISHDQSLQLMKQSDAVVRVSLKEGFGIALLEAMALKIPVIASRVGGLADFVSNQSATVANSSPSSIAAALIDTLTHKQKTQDKVKFAYQLSRGYTWNDIAARCRKELYGIE